jgi:hypothetical protein
VQDFEGSRNVQLELAWPSTRLAANRRRFSCKSGTRDVAVWQNAALFTGGLIDMPFTVATAQLLVFFDLVDHPRR